MWACFLIGHYNSTIRPLFLKKRGNGFQGSLNVLILLITHTQQHTAEAAAATLDRIESPPPQRGGESHE